LVSQGAILLLTINQFINTITERTCECLHDLQNKDGILILLFILDCVIMISCATAILSAMLSLTPCLTRHVNYFIELVHYMFWIMMVFAFIHFSIQFFTTMYNTLVCECYGFIIVALLMLLIIMCVCCCSCKVCSIVDEYVIEDMVQPTQPILSQTGQPPTPAPPPSYDIVMIYDRVVSSSSSL
jgi:hypothetical protein